jgi:hypothetical protein
MRTAASARRSSRRCASSSLAGRRRPGRRCSTPAPTQARGGTPPAWCSRSACRSARRWRQGLGADVAAPPLTGQGTATGNASPACSNGTRLARLARLLNALRPHPCRWRRCHGVISSGGASRHHAYVRTNDFDLSERAVSPPCLRPLGLVHGRAGGRVAACPPRARLPESPFFPRSRPNSGVDSHAGSPSVQDSRSGGGDR